MQSHTGLTAKSPTAGQGDATASGRIPVDIRRFPWIRRLASDYAFDYARLADFFAGRISVGDAAKRVQVRGF